MIDHDYSYLNELEGLKDKLEISKKITSKIDNSFKKFLISSFKNERNTDSFCLSMKRYNSRFKKYLLIFSALILNIKYPKCCL